MKKALWVVGIVCVAVALGYGGEKPVKPAPKFPYVGEKLNAPCGMTELEWRCAKMSYREPDRLKPDRRLEVAALSLEPSKKDLLVKAVLVPAKGGDIGPDHGHWQIVMERVSESILKTVNKELEDPNSVAVTLYWGSTLQGCYREGKWAAAR